jgi:hypothetical protein
LAALFGWRPPKHRQIDDQFGRRWSKKINYCNDLQGLLSMANRAALCGSAKPERTCHMFTIVSESLSFVAANAHCFAYSGLALAHNLAAGLSWRHHHDDHATIYACCGSLYGWLALLNVSAGH